MIQFSSYILCATPRSGTTLLCDLLAATGVMGRPNSYYREEDLARRAHNWGLPEAASVPARDFERAYLAAVLRAGTAATGIFGLRIMWASLENLRRRLAVLYPGISTDMALLEQAFGSILYVHLSRQDKVAQAVSRLRAEQGGLWHRAADGSERERTAPPQPPVYDSVRLMDYLEEAERDDAAWAAWFADQRIVPLCLSYEALSAAPHDAVASVLAALGRDPAIAATVAPRTAKLADGLSLEWAARLRHEIGREAS